MSDERIPSCHLAHIPAPDGHGHQALAAVWICEYPYRTMRMNGPSSDCAGCPVWTQIEQARLVALSADARAEIRQLESLMP